MQVCNMCGRREREKVKESTLGRRKKGNIEYNRASLTIAKVDEWKRDQQVHWDYAVKMTREEAIMYQP